MQPILQDEFAIVPKLHAMKDYGGVEVSLHADSPKLITIYQTTQRHIPEDDSFRERTDSTLFGSVCIGALSIVFRGLHNFDYEDDYEG
jgi:hypothetical protein